MLDLFAGTGALGIEALSRGATEAFFVERDGRALSALQRNLKELGFAERARIVGRDVKAAVRQFAALGVRFNWVFADPPYASGDGSAVLNELSGRDVLACGAVVMIEHDKRHEPPESSGELVLTDRRYYGDTGLSFYRLNVGLS